MKINRNINTKADIKPTVYVRVDGSPEKGLGHLVRCMALSHMLQNDFDIIFVCLQIPEKIKRELEECQFTLMEIEEPIFFALLKPKDIVVLDGYHFDTNYQKKIKATGVKLVCIDDLHDKEFVADLIINHTPGVKQDDYNAQPYTRYALGYKYALLRPSFIEEAKKERKIEKVETVLICFGGSDFKNLTERILQVVLEFDEFKKIIVVTGSAYNYLDNLSPIIQKHKNVIHYHSIREQMMTTLLQNADLAIVPSSGILFEALAVGCRVIFGYYAENQKHFSDCLKHASSPEICIDDMTGDITKLQKAIRSKIHKDWFSDIRYSITQSKNNNLIAFRQLMS